MRYIVEKGDTLTKIAQKRGVPLASLLILNSIVDSNRLFIGQEIQVPSILDIPPDAAFTAPIPATELVKRANSVVGWPIAYKLGAGGKRPGDSSPSDDGFCDCSGFICWVLGLPRKSEIPFYRNFGGWIYTDSIEADVKSKSGIFDAIDTPAIGCIVVYGASREIGHVGLVTEVSNGKMTKVIHCSSGNARRFNKHSVQETLPTVFERPDVSWGRFTR